MALTIFWEMGPAARAANDVAEGLVRVSVGLEDADDLLDDLKRAPGVSAAVAQQVYDYYHAR